MNKEEKEIFERIKQKIAKNWIDNIFKRKFVFIGKRYNVDCWAKTVLKDTEQKPTKQNSK